MSPPTKIICECGGELTRPIPPRCPHCGAVIVGVRVRWWRVLLPLAAIAAMFAALVLYVLWLSGRW